jgi:hypothetical protein
MIHANSLISIKKNALNKFISENFEKGVKNRTFSDLLVISKNLFLASICHSPFEIHTLRNIEGPIVCLTYIIYA